MTEYYATVEDVKAFLGFVDITLTDDIITKAIKGAQAELTVTIGRYILPNDIAYEAATECVISGALSRLLRRNPSGQGQGMDYSIDEFSVKKSTNASASKKTADDWKQDFLRQMASLKTEVSDIVESSDRYGV